MKSIDEEAVMTRHVLIQMVAAFGTAIAVGSVHADSFEEIHSVGVAGKRHAAAGTFAPVFDADWIRPVSRHFCFTADTGSSSTPNRLAICGPWLTGAGGG